MTPKTDAVTICNVRLSIPLALLVIIVILLPLTGCSKDNKQNSQSVYSKEDVILTHPSLVTQSELSTVLASAPTTTTSTSTSTSTSTPISTSTSTSGSASTSSSTSSTSLSSSPPPAANTRIVSAVVPHHLTASRLIINVMQLLAAQKPEVIIVIGPNHANKGNPIITGTYGWQTPEGIVETDATGVNLLLAQHLAVKDEDTLSTEHSIGSLVPLIRHYLPGTRIVPIILHHGINRQKVDSLLDTLKPIFTDKTVLIASVDFSHYLTRNEAQVKDQETLSYMKQYNYPALFRLDSDYLDSPASLTSAFLLAERQGIKEFTLLDNTNSGIILQNDNIETTSYFTLLFTAN